MVRRLSGTSVAVAFAGALALCLPAWHVLSQLLSDSYMTLYTGRWIAAHGIPHHEVFTVAARGRPWVDQQWLAELIDYLSWRAGGYAAVAILNALAIGCAYGLLAWVIRRFRVSVVLTVSACALAAVIALPAVFIRAQDQAMPLFAALLALCLTDRVAPIVPLLVLWANVHGSVLLGAALAVLYLLWRAWSTRRLRYVALAAAAALTPLATPYGIHIVDYYRALLGNVAVAAAAPENRPPALSDPYSLLFFVPLGLVLMALALRRRAPSVPVLGAVLVTGVATLFASRNVVWFGMTSAVLLAQAAQAALPTREPSPPFLRLMAATAGVSLVAGVVALVGGRYEALTPVQAITAAAAYAEQHPCTSILADNAASSALLWHDQSLAGRVGFDARLERYSRPALERWISFQLAEGAGWPATTRGYQILVGSSIYNDALVNRLGALGRGATLARDGRGIAVLTGSVLRPRSRSSPVQCRSS